MPANSARVSLCTIVRDEEQHLESCLTPVAELFDEIVIVDTGSEDRTKEIAARFTPHVYDFAWCEDFSAARNESLRRATGDWIFWLDADDRVRPEQVTLLRRLFQQLDERVGAYMMETMLPPAYALGELESVAHARLFRRHPALHWRGRVHEQLHPDFLTLGYQRYFTDIQIDHLGYTDRALAERKARRKLRLLRMDYAVDPNDFSTLFHLGMALRDSHPAEARTHLLRVVQFPEKARACTRAAYNTLAQMSLRAGQPNEALQWLVCGLSIFPNDEYLLFAQASAFYHLQDYAAAARTLECILRIPAVRHVHCNSLANLRTKLVPRMLGTIRRFQGRHAESQAILHAVLQAFPTDTITWYNLGLLYLERREAPALQALIDQLNALPSGSSSAGLLAALWHLRNGDTRLAGPIIDNLIAKDPRAPRPRMLRAEWLSSINAPIDDQIQALRDILRISPGSLETRRWLQIAMQAKQAQQQPLANSMLPLTPSAAAPVAS